MLKLLRIRNFLYTHGPKFGYEAAFTLKELELAIVLVLANIGFR